MMRGCQVLYLLQKSHAKVIWTLCKFKLLKKKEGNGILNFQKRSFWHLLNEMPQISGSTDKES